MSWSSRGALSAAQVRPYVFMRLDAPAADRGPGTVDREPSPAIDGPPSTVHGPPAPDPQPPAPDPQPPTPDLETIMAAAYGEGFRQGQQDGHREGYQAGLDQARADQGEATRQLIELARRALVDADGLVATVERHVVELSLAIARKIVERELRLDPATVVGVVRGALAELQVQDAPSVTVRVHPDDLSLVTAHWESLVSGPVAERSHLLADETVERGGCLIQTGSGQVDAQLSTKLAQITTVFQALLDGEAA